MNDTLNTAGNIDFQTDFDSYLETNFNDAIEMCSKKHEYNELITFLNSENIVEKQIAALELDEIKSKEDALILTSNLVGQDGKIREAVAFKLNELAKNPDYLCFFVHKPIFDLLFQGIMDINGNVCRQIVTGGWFKCKEFQDYLCKKLPESIKEILKHIEKLGENEKQYKISKRNFQLYWCLEALYNVLGVINLNEIENILNLTAEFEDYTIREKTAKILDKIDTPKFNIVQEKLKNDENYYVRRYLIK